MKEKIEKAVWMAMFIFCAAFVASCDSYDFTEEDRQDNLIEKECIVASNVFNADGAVAITRAVYDKPDGTLTATSNHVKKFIWDFSPVERKYQGFNYVKAFNVNRPWFAKDIKIFENPQWSEKVLSKDSIVQIVTFPQGLTHDYDVDLLETQYYDTDTVVVGGKSFQKCKNNWSKRQLVGSTPIALNRDSADFNGYKVILALRYELEEGPEGNRVVDWTVTIPLVWVPKPGTDPDIPEGDHEIISYDDGEKGIEILNDSIADSWQDLIPILSNTLRDTEHIVRKHVYYKYKLVAPEYRILPVADLTWDAQKAKASEPVKDPAKPDIQDRGDSIFCQAYVQAFTTYTSKCDAVFFGYYEGAGYYIDPLGRAHMFLDAKWSFTDNGWKDSKLDDLDGLKRLLLTSNITGTYLTQKPTAKGEVELRTGTDGGKRVVKFTHKDFGIRTIVPMSKYYTFATQVAWYSDNTSAETGEVGVDIDMSVDSPDDQTVQVYDWNIADTNPQLYDPAKEGEPRTKKVATGSFKIQKYSRVYATNTNKSEHKFTSHAETSVIFTDSLGVETQFLGIDLSYADNGSTKTLESLPDQDDKERKSMRPSVKVTAIGTDSNDYSGSVLLWKQKETEGLISEPEIVKQDLVYNGNGNWTSTTWVLYHWRIQGDKTEPYQTPLVWRIDGEQKKQIILDEAKADYSRLIPGTESSSTIPNGNITVKRTTQGYNEDYTTLKDAYTAIMETASYKATVDKYTVAFNFLAPTGMVVNHGSGSLVNGSRTTEKGGKTYDVWDHTGSVTATVTSSVGNQTETATDVKEVLVLVETKPVEPYNPAWGNVVGLINATLTYRPYVGDSGQGAFHKTLDIRFENGILIVTTASYGREGNWNPFDFTFDSDDFYYFEGKAPAGTPTDHIIAASANYNSAALFDNRWKPALLWPDGTGWKYIVDQAHFVNMSKQLAETCGIKNFSGKATADVTPYLNYTGTVSADKVLTVKSETGAPVFSIK